MKEFLRVSRFKNILDLRCKILIEVNICWEIGFPIIALKKFSPNSINKYVKSWFVFMT